MNSYYLTAGEVAKELGISRDTLYAKVMKSESFPKPYRLHDKANPLWVKDEVLAWRETRRAS